MWCAMEEKGHEQEDIRFLRAASRHQPGVGDVARGVHREVVQPALADGLGQWRKVMKNFCPGFRFRLIGALGFLFTLWSAYSLFEKVVSGEIHALAIAAPVATAVIGILILIGSSKVMDE